MSKEEIINETPWYLEHENRKGTTGFMVETKKGFIGRTYHDKGLINGKMPVYMDDQKHPMLCDPKTLLFVKGIKLGEEFDD